MVPSLNNWHFTQLSLLEGWNFQHLDNGQLKLAHWELVKGQIKPKADWRAVDSSNKRSNEFVFYAVKSKKTNSFVRSVFGRIYGAPICLRFYLTFSRFKSH